MDTSSFFDPLPGELDEHVLQVGPAPANLDAGLPQEALGVLRLAHMRVNWLPSRRGIPPRIPDHFLQIGRRIQGDQLPPVQDAHPVAQASASSM